MLLLTDDANGLPENKEQENIKLQHMAFAHQDSFQMLIIPAIRRV